MPSWRPTLSAMEVDYMTVIKTFKETSRFLGLLYNLGVFQEHVDFCCDKCYSIDKELSILFEDETH